MELFGLEYVPSTGMVVAQQAGQLQHYELTDEVHTEHFKQRAVIVEQSSD